MKPQYTNLHGRALLLLVVLIISASIYPALSSYSASLTIGNFGTIAVMNIYASGGSASDIQAAVDKVVAAGGIGNVHIPAGTHNFVEPGQLLSDFTVQVPAGINIYGATTQRTSGLSTPAYGMNPNDQVVAWATVLVLPSHDNAPTLPGAPAGIPVWFDIQGDGAPTKSTRISDIQFIGYRNIDPQSTQQTRAMAMVGVLDFRIDHCSFVNLGGGSVQVSGGAASVASGVIDHNRIENPAGGIIAPWAERTISYGINIGIDPFGQWEPDISYVLGQYTDYSVFIEDNYFSKWRHSITSNHGAHYVARYNTFNDTFGYGEVDCHIGNKNTEIGTRAIEVYNNEFINCVQPTTFIGVVFFRGGGGTIFNNYVDETYNIQEANGFDGRFIFIDCNLDRFPYTYVHDLWVWDNNETMPFHILIESGPFRFIPVEGFDYFLYEPHTFTYIPYTYPHPLTLRTYP